MTHFLIKKSYLLTIFFALSVLVLSGCAAPARIDQMAVSGNPAQRIAQTPLRNNLAIKDVTGGNETNPMWKSNVSSSDFEKALESSLQAIGLLAQRQSGKYLLTAHMERLDQPFMGLDMTVTASVKYIVSERATGKEVLSRTVSIPYTAKLGDSLLGVERLKLANEGAVRVNITELMNELFRLKIESVSVN
jgi:hypothetical protein